MNTGWTPGGRQKQRSVGVKGGLDDLLGDLLEDDVAPKKKSAPSPSKGRHTFGAKKQSSKDEDFYSSLAQAADEDDNVSDVSEADVNQMAKSIADLDDLDADLFNVGTATKVPKRGSLKDKSGKPGTPRRTGTPRSRSATPRASSPPLRASPANRITSPTHRVTSPPARGTPPISNGRDTPKGTAGIDPNRPGSGSKKESPSAAPMSPLIPEYKPNTAPAQMTDIGNNSAHLKPGSISQDLERPRTVPKAKAMDFGEFDENDPLAGIPISDDEEDLGLGPKSKPSAKQEKPKDDIFAKSNTPTPSQDTSKSGDASRSRSLFDRPPTRSGSKATGSEPVEKEEAAPPPPVTKPSQVSAPVKKKQSDELVFSDDDDFLGGLGIEEKTEAPKTQARPTEIEDEENRPAKSIMDKLLNKESVSKHLEAKEMRDFVLDTKYTQPAEDEDDFQFGSYMPSAAASNSSRPTSKRSVRFQDEDIFGASEKPPLTRTRSPPGKKTGDLDWLEMATAGRTPEKTTQKPPEPKPEPVKPKSSPADWLELTQDDDEEEFDYLKASSFSAPARQNQTRTLPDTDKKRSVSESAPAGKPPPPTAPKQPETVPDQSPRFSQPEPKATASSERNDDYLGLGEEIDPSKLLRTKSESPVFGDGAAAKQAAVLKDDIFGTPPSTANSAKSAEPSRGRPVFESAVRRSNMSPRKERSPHGSPRRSPERKINITPREEESPRTQSLQAQLQQMEPKDTAPPAPQAKSAPTQANTPAPSTAPQVPNAAPARAASGTDFFSFGRDAARKARGREPAVSQPQSVSQPAVDETDAMPSLPGETGYQPLQTGSQPYYSGSQTVTSVPMYINQVPTTGYQQQRIPQQRMVPLQQQYQYRPQMSPQQIPMGYMLEQPLFADGVDMDVQSKIRRLEIELEYSREILASTKRRYEEELQALENSYKGRLLLMEETQQKREIRWREENEDVRQQQLSRVRQMEEEKSEMIAHQYHKLEEFEREKSQEIERLKDIHRQALDHLKKDHEESLMRLKKSKDQQIDAAASSHDTSKSLVAAVSLIHNNAKDLGELQKKMDSWHAQGLDEREILARSKDEQLHMLQERLNKQQEDNEAERQRLQDLIARLESQIREQTRMLEEERWKVKQEQVRLLSLQTALEEERQTWGDQQARERSNNEKTREALMEEQKTTLKQLHKERQALAEEQVQFSITQKMSKEESSQVSIKTAQARAEFEALTKASAEARDRYEAQKTEIRKEESRIQEERQRLDRERNRIESKEMELIEAASMMQERSREVEEMYSTGQKKYEEGMSALSEAQRIETEEAQRIDTINQQLNSLRLKEKEMAEERLRLSKEKREAEKFRNTLLCPNCRTPSRQLTNGNIAVVNSPQTSPSPTGLLMPANGFPTNGHPNPVSNGMLSLGGFQSPPSVHPSMQLSVNTVDAVTEAIKSDRSIRLWKMEALKDQKYLEEQSMFLYTLKHMPYSSPKG